MTTRAPAPARPGPAAVVIDATGLHYRVLNERIHAAVAAGARSIVLEGVCGQRYIGDGLEGDLAIEVRGVPGSDLGAFMRGPRIDVRANAQDGVGNTMSDGLVAVHGDAGDIPGHSMRGGRVYIRGDAGYRVGIHMKAYGDEFPVVIVGGTVRDFVGEYMAGGLLVVLGLPGGHGRPPGRANDAGRLLGDFAGTGMHGGAILVRGAVDPRCVGREVAIDPAGPADLAALGRFLPEFCAAFGLDAAPVMAGPFQRLSPRSNRPYGALYAY
ncbi:MAG: hypothetical protein AAB152_01775 [Candidatus Coatesbacteria bacterium]